MYIKITDGIVSQYLSGVLVVFAVAVVGVSVYLVFKGLERRFPFSRLGLTVALTPLSLMNFVDLRDNMVYYVFAASSVVGALLVDGIQHLLTPKARPQAPAAETATAETAETPVEPAESKPDMIVWEKAK